jgi:hypothetical protein
MLTTVKNSVTMMFLEKELSKPTKGNIIKVDANDIINPTAVLVADSIKDCFFVCFILQQIR